jgi:hypothetical protein
MCLFTITLFFIILLFLLFSSGAYSLTQAKGVSRGTKIVIHLRQDAEEFSVKKTVESMLIVLFLSSNI